MFTNRQLFLHALAQTSLSPLQLEIEKAEGIYMYGPNGEKYIDLIAGISVSNVGHRHPAVIKAIEDQLSKFMHLMVYGEYIQSPQVKLAEKLKLTLPAKIDSVYFVNSGSEAVEGAMKLAKRFTGRTEIISYINAYHGSTQGALSLMGNEYFKNSYRPLLSNIRHIRLNELEDLGFISNQTAAVIIEPIQGEAGVIPARKDYLIALKEKCSQTGTLLIFDEIQSGFGRTGKFWAFDHYDVEPDIVVAAKGMGGGMPIGAFIASKEIMYSLTHNPILGHITTFGGHPVCCSASLATIQVLEDEKLIEQVETKANIFLRMLVHPKIKEVRNKGLLLAVQFEDAIYLKNVIDKLIQKGIVTDWFLFNDSSMRIAPPLIINEEEIRAVCNIIIDVLNE